MNGGLDLLAFAGGVLAAILGLVVLTEEHRKSPMPQRFVIGVMIILCLAAALDGAISADSATRQAHPLAASFAWALGGGWFFRLLALARERRRQRDGGQREHGT